MTTNTLRYEHIGGSPLVDSVGGFSIADEQRAIYEDAYGWEPPSTDFFVDVTAKVRTHLKRWINEWDLSRLYPDYTGDTEVEEVGVGRYDEQPELEQSDTGGNGVGAD